MLERYRDVICRMPHPVRETVAAHYPSVAAGRGTLYDRLEGARLGQADLVLCLLKRESPVTRRWAERLVGRPITTCPPCLTRYRKPPPHKRVADDRRFIFVSPKNPRLPSTPAFGRFRLLKVGGTVRSFLNQGGTRRDLRIAIKRGAIKLEKMKGVSHRSAA